MAFLKVERGCVAETSRSTSLNSASLRTAMRCGWSATQPQSACNAPLRENFFALARRAVFKKRPAVISSYKKMQVSKRMVF